MLLTVGYGYRTGLLVPGLLVPGPNPLPPYQIGYTLYILHPYTYYVQHMLLNNPTLRIPTSLRPDTHLRFGNVVC